MANNLTQVIGLTAGIITASSMIPQLIKTIKHRKVEDVSPYMFIMLLAGTGLWTYYGVRRDDLPIIITNGFSFCLNLLMLILSKMYSDNSQPDK